MPIPRAVARANKRFANRVIGPVARYLPMLAVVHHVGRRTGRRYAVPVNVFRDDGDIIVPVTYGSGSDWVRNVLAAGGCEVEHRGRRLRIVDARLETDHEKRWAPWPVRRALALLDVHEVVRLRQG